MRWEFPIRRDSLQPKITRATASSSTGVEIRVHSVPSVLMSLITALSRVKSDATESTAAMPSSMALKHTLGKRSVHENEFCGGSSRTRPCVLGVVPSKDSKHWYTDLHSLRNDECGDMS